MVGEVLNEMMMWVQRGRLRLNDNGAAVVKVVSLVRWQDKQKGCWCKCNSVSECDFVQQASPRVIRLSNFTEPHEHMEGGEDNADEKQVVKAIRGCA